MRITTPSSSPVAFPADGRRLLRRRVRAAAVVGCCGLLAAACSSGTKSPSSATTGTPAGGAGATLVAAPTKVLNIVVGENFWGSIASQLAGKAGKVTSIVTDPNADPHTYESSSDNARAFADASYVVLNGAGYDAWADKLIKGNANAKRKVLTIADLLGKKEGDNPHFWYQPDYVTRVADQVTADLKSIDSADAAYFDAQRATFDANTAPMRARLRAIKSKFAGTPVASTESIFVYLADNLGLKVVSPPEFMQAVAEGNDPPAPLLATFQDLLSKKQPKVLVYNQQTSTAVTSNLKKIATNQGIPVIGVTETIQPPDATFQEWFGAELLDLQNALNADSLTGAGGSSSSPSTTGG
jgi:zinc/manganese transport system substrate-binding protein